MGSSGAIRRRLAICMAVLTASGLFALAAPGTAQAATAPTKCAGRKVRTLSFATGSIQIYRNSAYVCAITLPSSSGRPQWMTVSVQARGSHPAKDEGLYSRRAGPVTVRAGHRPVLVKGSVGRGSASSGWIVS